MVKRLYILILLLFVAVYSSYSYSSLELESPEIETLADASKRHKYLKHKVKQGEGISSILKIYNLPLKIFIKDNLEFKDVNHRPSVGDNLRIRKKSIGDATNKQINEDIKDIYSVISTTKKSNNIKPYTKQDLRDIVYIYHTIRAKETLYSISKRYNVSIDDIKVHNRSLMYDQLKLGETLVIPTNRDMERVDGSNLMDSVRFQKEDGISVSVAVMLPFTGVSKAESTSMMSLFKGVLIAINQLKEEGLNVNVTLLDTKKDIQTVRNIISSGSLVGKDIIIGPVYDEQFSVVANYANRNNIVIASPLLPVSSGHKGVVQFSPVRSAISDKVGDVLIDKNVLVFLSDDDDKQFLGSVREFLNNRLEQDSIIREVIYEKDIEQEYIDSLMVRGKKNLFVIPAKRNVDVELIYSKVSSISKLAPSMDVEAFGTSAFSRFDDLRKSDLFNVNTYFTTSYHTDRLNEKVLYLDDMYIHLFNERPSMMSYRGYDVAMILLDLYSQFEKKMLEEMDGLYYTPLQVMYSFVKEESSDKIINDEWPLVNYKRNKTIEIK